MIQKCVKNRPFKTARGGSADLWTTLRVSHNPKSHWLRFFGLNVKLLYDCATT
jgi:hypothetical protein